MTQRSPFESIRKGMETKTGQVGVGTLIVLGAMGLAGCAQEVNAGPDKNPSVSSSETPGNNSGETANLTYQQEIQKGIEARPKEGVRITVADYPSLEVAAKEWTNAYTNCLLSGNIQMTTENHNEYSARTPGTITEFVPRDFKLADNFEMCVEGLFADNEVANKLVGVGESLNSAIVIQQFIGTDVQLTNQDFSAYDETDNSIKARLNCTIDAVGKSQSDTTIGGKLEVVDGMLVATDRL